MWRTFYQRRREAFLKRHIFMQASQRFTRKNIYIVPTKAGFGLLATLAVILFAAINYENNSLYLFSFIVLAVFLLSILATFENLLSLDISQGPYSLVEQGQPVNFHLLLKKANGKRCHALSLFWGEDVSEIDTVEADILAVSVTLGACARGVHTLPRFKVETRFPFGLVKAWGYAHIESRVFVYPMPERSDLDALGSVQEENRQKRLESDDFANIRPWRQGESPKRILWRAYARTKQLLSLEYDYQSPSPAYLDWYAIEGEDEYKLRVLCYWVLYYSRLEQPFALHMPNHTLGYDTGDTARVIALKALASFGYDDVDI